MSPPLAATKEMDERAKGGGAVVALQRVIDKSRRSIFAAPTRIDQKSIEDNRVAELADIIRTYRGLHENEDEEQAHPFLDGPIFDITMCTVILLNILVIGLEMDYGGNKVGYDRDPLWILLEWIFCLIFAAEVGIKVRIHTMEWFREDSWSFLSLFVAIMAFVELVILQPMKIGGLRMISLIRIVNLIRLKKVIEHHKMLKELKLVLRGMVGSWVSLFWAMVVLLLVYFVFAVWTTTLIGYHEGFDDLKQLTNGWDNEELFGSILKSMFTLMQVMTLDSWCSSIVRHVAIHKWYMIFFFLAFMMLTTYGIMNLIVSIIVEQTLEASAHSETRVKAREEKARVAEMESIKEIFLLSDADANGDLTLQEFSEAVDMDSEVQWRLRQLELEVDAAKRLFMVIDGDGSRTLSMKEFVDGCTKLKGTARSKDLLALQHQADSMSKQMDLLGIELQDSERMLARLDTATQRMTSRFGPTVLSSRRAIHDRVRGAAPQIPLPVHKHGSLAQGHLAAGNMPRLPLIPNLTE